MHSLFLKNPRPAVESAHGENQSDEAEALWFPGVTAAPTEDAPACPAASQLLGHGSEPIGVSPAQPQGLGSITTCISSSDLNDLHWLILGFFQNGEKLRRSQDQAPMCPSFFTAAFIRLQLGGAVGVLSKRDVVPVRYQKPTAQWESLLAHEHLPQWSAEGNCFATKVSQGLHRPRHQGSFEEAQHTC